MFYLDSSYKPLGYQALIERLELKVMPHYRLSYLAPKGQARTEIVEGKECHIYPKGYATKDSVIADLEFALKYDGVNLEILKAIFLRCGPEVIFDYIKQHPTGKYARKLWFLYEYLLDTQLEIPDVGRGNYFDLLEADQYYTATSAKSPRHRINNNLLGNQAYCPMVRRTAVLDNYINKHLQNRVREVLDRYPEEVISRASQFLYLKETKSSFEIERERPDLARSNRFVEALRMAGQETTINKETLIALQNMIVDSRFADKDYRTSQNYVGEVLNHYREKLHYISPKPQDLLTMMAGWMDMILRLEQSELDAVIQASVIAFGFVFIHPFEDGNGRIHRYLVHQVLTKNGFTPGSIIFPVSAVMLANSRNYDACLESFSRPLLGLTEYRLKRNGELQVLNETADFYRYFDATIMAEYLFSIVESTIDNDLVNELEFIVGYAHAKERMQEVIDMPVKKIDLFIKLCMSNRGQLSGKKRENFFNFLTDSEVEQLEEIVKSAVIHDRNQR